MSERGASVADLVAILFVAGEGADRRAVQRALDLTPVRLARLIEETRRAEIPGLLVQEHEDVLRLVTHPDAADAVRRFVQAPHAVRLSNAALETLAVIAYSQPATRAQVQEARGVNSEGPIQTLLQHGLIEEAGRAEGPGRPTLFHTTPDFLALLGIGSLEDLPDLRPSGWTDEERGRLIEFPDPGASGQL